MFRTLEVYYQNTRGLRTNSDEIMSNVLLGCSDIICLTDTWLCAGISSLSYFPSNYDVYRQDGDYNTTGMKLGGGVLVAVKSVVQSNRRKGLESYSECTWVEIPTIDSFNYFIGNHNFLLLFDEANFTAHIEALQTTITCSKFQVQVYGDFNLPGINWATGIDSCTTSVTSRNASICRLFFNFSQYNEIAYACGNILDLCLSNSPLERTMLADNPLVPVDAYHPPFIAKFSLSGPPRAKESSVAFCYSRRDYLGLYRFLEQYNWSEVLTDEIVDPATERLSAIVKNAVNVFVPKRLTC